MGRGRGREGHISVGKCKEGNLSLFSLLVSPANFTAIIYITEHFQHTVQFRYCSPAVYSTVHTLHCTEISSRIQETIKSTNLK